MCNQKINCNKPKKKIRWGQLISLFLIAATLSLRIFVNCKYYVHVGDGLARLTGGVLGIYLLSLGIWKWLFKKKQGYLLGCFSVVLLLSSFASISKKMPEIMHIHNAKQELSKIFLHSSNVAQKDYYCAVTDQNKDCGKLSPLLTLIKTQVALDQKEYATVECAVDKVSALFLNIKDLNNLDKLVRAVKQTEEALICLNKTEMRIFQRFNNRPKEIEKLNMEEKFKKQALIGYNKQAETTKGRTTKMFNAWRNGIEASKIYYKFLIEKQGSYSVGENLLLFTKDEDALQTNIYMQNIEKYANEFSQICNEYDSHMREQINSL